MMILSLERQIKSIGDVDCLQVVTSHEGGSCVHVYVCVCLGQDLHD